MTPESTSLFIEHRLSLVDYAAGIVGSRAAAEDVVQEAWLRFDEVSRRQLLNQPLSYLYRIVRNLAIDGHRKQVREERYMVPGAAVLAESLAEDRPTPEAEAEGRGELRALLAAMQELPERTRVALEMHRMGGATLREIAEYLGISVGLAHTLVIDGLEHCRARLARPAAR
ncbi:sigma-70 family RNA polymerase sigma factor [Reyranella sp.]|uniref:sigma-70 family RNA polymerase sigma factor n=1 Tax=Reyranella sp. TaxID=1929291 RepID=UPI0025D6EB84|nr:sigma-70 family RNA polymerase sigma factor [Reyranella sp.]